MDLCKEMGIPCIEKNLDVYDVVNADEAFMTGTPFCMLPVTSLDGQKIGKSYLHNLCEASEFDEIISDTALPKDLNQHR